MSSGKPTRSETAHEPRRRRTYNAMRLLFSGSPRLRYALAQRITRPRLHGGVDGAAAGAPDAARTAARTVRDAGAFSIHARGSAGGGGAERGRHRRRRHGAVHPSGKSRGRSRPRARWGSATAPIGTSSTIPTACGASAISRTWRRRWRSPPSRRRAAGRTRRARGAGRGCRGVVRRCAYAAERRAPAHRNARDDNCGARDTCHRGRCRAARRDGGCGGCAGRSASGAADTSACGSNPRSYARAG